MLSVMPLPILRPCLDPGTAHMKEKAGLQSRQLPRIAASPQTGAEREEIKTMNNQD